MIIDAKDVVRVIALSSEIRQLYNECAMDADERPVSMNTLVYVIGKFSGKKIDAYVTKWSSEYLFGSVKVWDDRAEVDISSELNLCYRRFVGCKEISHLVIDEETSYTRDVAALIKTFTQPQSTEKNGLIQGDKASELLAVYVAMELLFPFEERAEERRKIDQGDQKYWDVAEYYKIPEAYVEWFLSDSMMGYLTEIHAEIDQIP